MTETRQKRRNQQSKKNTNGKNKNIFKRILIVLFSIFVFGFTILTGLFFYYASTAPEITAADLQGATETEILWIKN